MDFPIIRLGGELMDFPVGEVRVGNLADLLLVDGDPLADIRILQDCNRIPLVMKNGRFHRCELDE